MKIRIITILLIVVIISTMSASIAVFAQSSSQSSADAVNRCTLAQINLNGTVRKQDLQTRVYRAQAYLYIYERLDVFVQRLEHNNQPDAVSLRSQTTELGHQITKFKLDYEIYDQAREATANLKNCATNQNVFMKRLGDARAKRQQINTDITTLDGIVGTSVKSRVVDLYTQILATGTSGAQNE